MHGATPRAPHCEHAFCNACITQWFAQQQICPVDRTVVTLAHLRPVPRIMRNMLSKLQISCDNASFGCTATLRLDQLQSHLKDCEHNPKRPKRDIQLLKAYMRAIRSANPNLQNLEESIEYNEILEWVKLAAACPRDALGRHDLNAGRRPAGRH
ncbi:E3 ubiquitin-protein ligase NRDP1 [Bagarius yarrelli]|uniref:E3 ubiquitin-protein ligase NRDP1 n=1 Tax=Bagarius yarrelli TaxID=175774 RepID=A0A556UYN0_BAGYA|nr:E3 ubiquitin-protein ligase NRDP1 [Bagarius yarrelli]